jgi:hypothetical protein
MYLSRDLYVLLRLAGMPFGVGPREFYALIFHKGVVKILNRPSVMVIFSRFASYWALRIYSRINTGHE